MFQIRCSLLLVASLCFANHGLTAGEPAKGPLKVSTVNPRYFTDGQQPAILLVGAHIWNNCPDMTGNGHPAFDFDAYLDFLDQHHHNFIRFWRWESILIDSRTHDDTENTEILDLGPHPWLRTGPGLTICDAKPKFDLDQFDPVYFDRLRERLRKGQERGIYMSVMLFEGWSFQRMKGSFQYHPFHLPNNINGVDADTDGDGLGLEFNSLPMDPKIQRLQEAYVRKVVETVNEFDNVLYEICNEAGSYSTEWQYHTINLIREIESKLPKQHPVGMTFQFSRVPERKGTNQILFDSPADWISPNPKAEGGYDYSKNPPPSDGRKVIVSDTDHLWGLGGSVNWAWESFVRGHNMLFMDPYDSVLLGKNKEKNDPLYKSIREALGQTRLLSQRIDLTAMTPHEELAPTKFCLANPGHEYVIYLPEGGSVEVDLSGVHGTASVEWIHPVSGSTKFHEEVQGAAQIKFTSPIEGAAVLYVKKM